MRALHLFAGGGGSLYAGALLGHTAVAAVEIDEDCCDGLVAEWPGLMVWRGDARGCDYARLAGAVDCVMAGWPCQDIARMGERAGLAGERSGLWSEVVRALRETGAGYALLENGPDVPVLGLDRIAGDLADLGLGLRWGVLGAAVAGAPHGRARWFGLAHPDRKRRVAEPPAWLHADGSQRHDADGCGLWPPRRGDAHAWREFIGGGGPEPGIRRPADGVAMAALRFDLSALGNGWCPQQAVAAWYLLGGP